MGGNDQIKWKVYDISAPYQPITEQGDKFLAQGGNFEILFNNSPGTSRVEVTIYYNGIAISTKVINVTRNLYSPQQVNNGVVNFCGSNETVTVMQPDLTACDFHYPFIYSSPAGFLMDGPNFNQTTYSGRTLAIQFSMTSPSSISNGAAGYLNTSARWTEGGLSQNRDTTTPIWVGPPTVISGEVNGTPYNGGVYNIYGGQASLGIQVNGGGSANWSITSGSGTLYPNGNSSLIVLTPFYEPVLTRA